MFPLRDFYNADDIDGFEEYLKTHPKAKFFIDTSPLVKTISDQRHCYTELLLKYGAETNRFCEVISTEYTILKYAILCGDARTVELLLQYGADPDATNNDVYSKYFPYQGFGFRDIDDDSPIAYAAFLGKEDVVRLLVQYGAKIDKSSLIFCCRLEKTNTLIYLLDHLTSPNQIYDSLCYCAQNGYAHSMEAILIRIKDIDVNKKDRGGKTAMYYACKEGKTSCVDLLLKYGADPLISYGEEKVPAFHMSVALNYTEIVEMLIQRGVNPNAQDLDGWTPLHYTSVHDLIDLAQLLKNMELIEEFGITKVRQVGI